MQTIARIRMPENGVFQCRVPGALALMPGEAALAELDYGLDVGTVLELYGVGESRADAERVPSYRLIRRQTPDDAARCEENAVAAERARHAFQVAVSHEKGHVKVLYARFSYGRDRLFLRYAAQMPVDLRRFVGQIQRDFKTHVDLWQVGVRDEASMIGCLGPCGRAVCCCSWQRQFHSVNVRMAKVQEMSLNPVTINGSCGRLKCCLRFEYEQYRAAAESLPETGSVVRSGAPGEELEGLVVARDVLRGQVTMRTRDGRFVNVTCAGLVVVRAARREDGDKEEQHEDSGGEWSES